MKAYLAMGLGTLPGTRKNDETDICMFLSCKVVGVEFFAYSDKVHSISVSYKLNNMTHIKRVNPRYVFVDYDGGYDLSDIPGGVVGMDLINNSMTTKKLKRFANSLEE